MAEQIAEQLAPWLAPAGEAGVERQGSTFGLE
jgi:hypothetical protein